MILAAKIRIEKSNQRIAVCVYNILFCWKLNWYNNVYMVYIPLQYIPRNMHTVFALLDFVVVIHWLIFPYPSGLLHWHCGNLTIAPVPAKQPWWIWINTSCDLIMNDCITTTKQSTTKPCAYFLGYTVVQCIQTNSLPHCTTLCANRKPHGRGIGRIVHTSSTWTPFLCQRYRIKRYRPYMVPRGVIDVFSRFSPIHYRVNTQKIVRNHI